MPPRLFMDPPLRSEASLALPESAARHVQVLRLQPGASLTLFDGQGGEWNATVLRMGRRDVEVRVLDHLATDRELPCAVTLALGMPTNDRMDDLVEKATELGAARIQPLLCERSVLRLSGERADKRVAHWQAVAIAACEQSGRTRVPRIAPVLTLSSWLQTLAARADESRWLLSLRGAQPLLAATRATAASPAAVLCLSGPEGGLAEAEEAAALAHGFTPISLGARVLRADTAPLALLAHLALACGPGR